METKLTEVLSLNPSDPTKKADTSEDPLFGWTLVLSTSAVIRELGAKEQKL